MNANEPGTLAYVPHQRKDDPCVFISNHGSMVDIWVMFTFMPANTRFVAKQLGTAHWYSQEAAKRDLGYHPSISMVEGFNRLRESLAVSSDSEGKD